MIMDLDVTTPFFGRDGAAKTRLTACDNSFEERRVGESLSARMQAFFRRLNTACLGLNKVVGSHS